MPDRFELPTTPEQWAAIEPNETDRKLNRAWLESESYTYADSLAAASRLLERERCVEALKRVLLTEYQYMKLVTSLDAEARRILGVASPESIVKGASDGCVG